MLLGSSTLIKLLGCPNGSDAYSHEENSYFDDYCKDVAEGGSSRACPAAHEQMWQE